VSLEETAAKLASTHRPLRRPRVIPAPLLDYQRLSSSIARATRGFRTPRPEDPRYQKASEWFLDNHYLVARALRQIGTEIPHGFRRRLPYVGEEPRPRVLVLAEALVEATSLDFDESTLVAFIDAYQTQAPLTIAELWALPAMLRIAVLLALARVVDTLFMSRRAGPKGWERALEIDVLLERAIRVLRLLAEMDWRTVVQRTSAVEAALREDPAGVYAHMDFESRDTYRKVVEALAWDTERAEPEVARTAVALAVEGKGAGSPGDPREAHVGYYLVDRGLLPLKKRIGYRARGLDRVRDALHAWPTLAYLGGVGVVSLLFLSLVVPLGVALHRPGTAALLSLVFLVPVSSIAVAFVNWWVTRLLFPRPLPKLDFAEGIPPDCRTAVVIPALVSRPEDFEDLLAQAELHYLSCPDPSLAFVLLTDHVDSSEMPDDSAIVAHAESLLGKLNAKYGSSSAGPFHVMHREARWCAGEGCFMGWERKRGKLEELNRFLRGDTSTSYKYVLGDRAGLERVRFIITLDADTQLPIGAARRLVGLAAHPLNSARFDTRTGRVTSGYTVTQPRVEASPVDGATSRFSRTACGDTALDIYTRAASDVYQDLFGSGAYVGKGIYEVDPFMRSIEGRVPPDSLASHDLFEGIHGRAALATDVVVFEQYPQNYLSFARRTHRWIRGDWQLLPWLFPRVPSERGARLPNRLSVVDRWKILDNLRRSLLAPSLVTAFFVAWLELARPAAVLVLIPLLVPLAMLGPAFIDGNRRQALGRWALGIAFLPHEAWVAGDAIVRTLYRLTITRRHMLEWVTAADTARAYAQGSRRQFWREMGPASALTTFVGMALGCIRPSALPFALPFLVLWLLSPEVALWVSAADAPKEPLSPANRTTLRHLARRTWLFFETFVGPGDQWLAPDNFQQVPGAVVAHRTSPTNIGLMLVADLCAYDLGYIGRAELSALVHQSLETLTRLERYRGHWLNWYDTHTLEPLLPRYVSTVDSGNLAAALLTLAKGCRDAAEAPGLRPVRFQGLGDTLDLLEESLDRLDVAHPKVSATIATLRSTLTHAHLARPESDAAARLLSAAQVPALETALLDVLDQTTALHDVGTFREVQTWLDRLRHQMRSVLGDVDPRGPRSAVRDDLLAVADRIDAVRADIDFTFLFDRTRKLFRIGYNATSDRLDAHYYDLLASEARLASFLAVVESQVPPEHWFTLGRPITRIQGGAALVSWGGTMFEYLMPTIFMRSRERTLLEQSSELAVLAQIAHGKKTGEPWGVSESGFAQLDAQRNYQYRSFGVPELGLRRGLDEDRVIAPYACVLALPFRPHEVIENLEALESLGATGLYGLYEAVDYDEARALEASIATGEAPRKYAVVRSHMAHHQGMILASLNNAINDDVLVERFHSDALVKTGEPLLSERLPSVRLAEELAPPTKALPEVRAAAPEFPGWVPERDVAQTALLGNGRLTTVVTDTGAGFTSWNGLAVTRGVSDAACDVDGTWIYVRDEANDRVWSAAPAPTRGRIPSDEILFLPHQVEFHHRDGGISLRTEIAIDAVDDVEIRHITLHNETAESRTLTLMTYAEPVLESAAGAARQPAFSRLFVECEALPEQHAMLASRRPRSPEDPRALMVQSLVWSDRAVSWIGSETDRRTFVGRRRDARTAQCRVRGTGSAASDASTLDPAVVLAVRIDLAPRARVDLALVTAVAKTREAVLELTRRFGSLHAARWVAQDARRELARRLDREGMSPALFPHAMRLVSRLFAPTTSLRAARSALSGAQPSKNSLWGHGISGDDPLLVVRVHELGHDAFVEEVLATHRFLRSCGRTVEVVFLDEASSTYQADEPGSVRSIAVNAGVSAWLNQRGGVFVLATDQLGADGRARISQAARVLLDSEKGSLAEQVSRAVGPAPVLPPFLATRPVDPEPGAPLATPRLVFENPYGGFTEDGREYVVKAGAAHAAPAPWCNVLANAEAGCLVSESSLGATWAGNSGENRLTPWRNDPVTDTPSEALYLRDEETAQVWSPTPLPAGLDVDTLVRHGAGYTIYERESHGLRQELTVFVPTDAPVKIVRLTLTNRLARPRRLTATYYVEWVLGALREEQRAHVVCEADVTSQCLLARCGWNADFADKVAFLSADRAPHGFTFDRAEFLGRSGSLARPEALGRWGLSGSMDGGADPCAALQTHVEIPPGASVDVHFVLGQGRDKAHALELAGRFRPAAEIEASLLRVHAYWDRVLGAVQVKTPEPAMNLLLNRWLLYQSLSCRLLARTAFYQSSGAFGYRDQLQDVMALTYGAPELARAHILTAAAHQFEEGDVLHWWHPPADRGVRTRCSDDMAWLAFVTAHYVEATGDASILDEVVPFLTAPALKPDEHDRYSQFATSSSTATLHEHCRRALQRALTEGAHGLPLMGDSDWNDGMSRVGVEGKGESVWLGFFLCATMSAFARLSDRRADAEEAALWRDRVTALGARLDETAWDGAWYLRAFYDDGTPLGGASSRACRIDSIAQSWAVLSSAVDPDRAIQAVHSADDILVKEKERLVLVLDPPFDGTGRHNPGYIQAYPPGIRENGGQYTHAATWLGFAHSQTGDGVRAERVFRMLNPVLHAASAADADRYRVEPYALAGDVYGAAPFTGRGGWTWYTGAAAWMWRLGVEAILGLRKEDGALRVDPCIPPHWPGFEATIRLGDQQECHVVVDNANGVGRGVVAATLDGVALDSPLVKPGVGPSRRELRIVLGAVANAAE
jgi:cyclic beta-1,2-glucan synthetase